MANSKYETLYIINADLDEEATAAVVERFKSLVESNGTLTSIDEWGKRRLAYEINHMTEGYYVHMAFEAPRECPAELDRIYNITDSGVRGIIVNRDEK